MRAIVQILIPLLLMINSSAGIHILELLKNYGLTNTYAIKTQPLPRFSDYDFIVVGSGPGGAPVANRLSENRNWKVLLLEAGKPEGILNQVPMLSFVNSEYDWQYTIEPQKKACLGIIDRRCPYPKGKALGGSSTINSMVYSRGNKLDFDLWAQQGNYGWSYDDVLPYFKKSERAKLRETVDESYHGKSGYLHVQDVSWRTPLASKFLESGRELGYDIIDYNGRRQIGFSYGQFMMLDGTRCSSSKAYLQVRRSNLDIVTEARVSRVLIDGNNCAYGVEFTKNNRTYRINASKEVILSAGAIDTPKLLMLSGIGPKEHLEELGIRVVKDAKVGYNLCDHVAFAGLTFLVNQSVTLIQKNVETTKAVLQYAIKGTGPYSTPNANEGLAFVRTKYAKDVRPDVELVFRTSTFNGDNEENFRRGRRVTQEIYDAVWKPIEGQDAWAIWPAVQLIQSKGRIKLRSTNINDHPLIDPNLFDDSNDLETLVEAVKIAIKVSESKAFQQYGTKLHDTKIPGCESFEFGTDDYWRCAIQHVTVTFNHDMGTVKMGPSTDSSAVVDPELRVYGIGGLRVIDASIMPEMPVGHLSATTYMIAEKGADMIKKSW
ncbi:glucose dehydrogenase [FAD, quinone]-like [Diachasma alloeum]|uniref:glucose dehydrogenase [FAD, quinone]-like n=1 Tax=Diachasma alloeum TaxID=454923 RepID=UPI0007381F80|nr:glucose dehydrogenase [FAD, quinone]-like [Diachasma alloeum]